MTEYFKGKVEYQNGVKFKFSIDENDKITYTVDGASVLPYESVEHLGLIQAVVSSGLRLLKTDSPIIFHMEQVV